jgi:5-enolpyruvylshikimate-3-phosphate synthase
LNNWKMNILGYRDEMRDAETAQLEALLKILKALGGEVETDPNEMNIQAQLSNP